MKSNVEQGLILLFVSLLAAGSLDIAAAYDSDDRCTAGAVGECFGAFNNKWIQQTDSSLITGLKLSEEEMQELCSDFDVVKHCMSRFQRNCEKTERKLFEGVYAMYDYVCHKGLQVYMRNQDCLSTPALTSEIRACNATAERSYQDIAEKLYNMHLMGYVSQDDMDKQKKKFCGTADDLMHCLKVSTSKYCNLETRDFVANIFDALLKPMLDEVDCGNGGFNTLIWYAIASAAGLVCTALVGWCVGMYVQKQRRRRQGQGQSTGQVLGYSDRSMLTTNEEYYDDPPQYRSQVQMQQQTQPAQPIQSNQDTEPGVDVLTIGTQPPRTLALGV